MQGDPHCSESSTQEFTAHVVESPMVPVRTMHTPPSCAYWLWMWIRIEQIPQILLTKSLIIKKKHLWISRPSRNLISCWDRTLHSKYLLPKLKESFPQLPADASADQLYAALNVVCRLRCMFIPHRTRCSLSRATIFGWLIGSTKTFFWIFSWKFQLLK